MTLRQLIETLRIGLEVSGLEEANRGERELGLSSADRRIVRASNFSSGVATDPRKARKARKSIPKAPLADVERLRKISHASRQKYGVDQHDRRFQSGMRKKKR